MSGYSPTPPPSRAPRANSVPAADPSADASRHELWLSTGQVAERLQIPAKTLTAWAAAGRGPRFARMGRHRRYRLSDLLVWEQQQLDDGGGTR
ncbi:helix-turn-helix domain-containing protein [Nocardia takedensis]|uniref:helix-turn-helix domain-containing protein n=1 Tax=Nocardia takedensis TaxID=259390 RepID=UPI000307F55B|nr:helix-turn-helix domain-containing protein [Nocardia takedensis]